MDNIKATDSVPSQAPHPEPRRKKRSPQFIVGVLIMIFALIGLCTIAGRGIAYISDAAKERKTAEYEKYDTFLLPVVAVDPTPFDDITGAKMSELIEISVWSIISSDLDPDKYDYSTGELAIPASEVEEAYVSFFGSEVPIVKQSVEGYGYEFAYDEAEDVFYIPLTSITPIYTPEVTDIDTKGGATTLTCGLINSSVWMQDNKTGDIKSPAPDKYLKITLREIKGISFISAIQSSATPETASTQAKLPAATDTTAVTDAPGTSATDTTAQ